MEGVKGTRYAPLPQILVVPQVLPDTASQTQISSIQVGENGDAKLRWKHLQVYKTRLLFTYKHQQEKINK